MTLLERLKIETRPAHDRIEAAIDLDRRIASRDAYRDLLIRFTASTRPGKVTLPNSRMIERSSAPAARLSS